MSSEIDEIISQLNDCEKKVMIIIGGLKASTHKNVKTETIIKRLPDKDIRCGKKAIKSLAKHGLIHPYRPGNYAVGHIGMKVAITLKKEDQKDKYKELSRILLLIP